MKTFKLENEPKIKSGFTTPEHYFNDFSAKILEEINQTQTKVIPLYKRKKVWTTFAAAAVVVSLMIPIVNHYRSASNDLDAATLENYISYQSNINQYDLIQKLDDKDIQKLNSNIALEEETLEDILSSNPNIEHLITE
ncbi:hypothetical protein [Flavobacterium foetidum]|uniref:hypothetical protein n=1 Tax=Flavobacterium foetidum TaxID=2026681 RepID=UPI001074F6CF|nr:hypothetical protein [Flavobacterium foetidum]KAF2517093.1 hypothetical protein E0W73_03065 [Flavobacterium foetidum]